MNKLLKWSALKYGLIWGCETVAATFHMNFNNYMKKDNFTNDFNIKGGIVFV